MKSHGIRTALANAMLLSPALFVGASGFLYVVFGVESANRLLDALLANAAFKWILSPGVVLGGSLIAFGLNARKVVHVSAQIANEELIIALSVKRLVVHLIGLGFAGGLLLLLAMYAFVENFRIIAR